MSRLNLTTFPQAPRTPRRNDPARLAPVTEGEQVPDGLESIFDTLSDAHKRQIENYLYQEKVRICDKLANLGGDSTDEEKKDLQATAIAVNKLETYLLRTRSHE